MLPQHQDATLADLAVPESPAASERAERDLDQPYARASEDPPTRREIPGPSSAELEAALRADPATPPEAISWLDQIDARRTLVAHLRDHHNRVLPNGLDVGELRQIHRILDETERER